MGQALAVTSPSAHASAVRPFYAAQASAYDLLITDPVEPWVAFVDNTLRTAGLSPAAVLDAGCGTGRHAAALVALGHDVELADASAALLELAVARCPGATVHEVDLTNFAPGPRFDAVICRGVLNDMVLDSERQACLTSFEAALRPGGMVILDLRDAGASQERADGSTRESIVETLNGERLHYRSTPSWDAGLIRVHETYELTSEAGTESTQYDFTMRPWSIDEATERLTAAGFVAVDIRKGVGRKTDDRFIAVAHTALPVSAPA